MKIWNNYKKEIKIASRGFYFYMEIIIAIVFLAALLFLVPTESGIVGNEVVFMDMSDSTYNKIIEKWESDGRFKQVESKTINLKPITITYFDENTGEKFVKEFNDKKEVTLDTFNEIDSNTNRVTEVKYFTNNFDDMLRIAYSKKYAGARMWFDDDGVDYYQSLLFGSETDRYKNLISIIHGKNINSEELINSLDNQDVRFLATQDTLNFRQSFIPLVLVVMNGLMGMMILIAYISIDKAEGLIKAYVVTPSSMKHYLISKILVVVTTVIISSFAVTVPVMGSQPNYLLLILSLLMLTVLSCTIGLILGSIFNDLKSSFGVLLLIMLVLILPVMTYILPSFSPMWMKFIPTFYMIDVVKECLLSNVDIGYVLLVNLGMLALSVVFFLVSEKRYKKVLNI